MSLYDLLYDIKDRIKNDKHLKKFEIERNALSMISMPILNSRFFGQVDYVLKEFLIPIILEKQRA